MSNSIFLFVVAPVFLVAAVVAGFVWIKRRGPR